ncbi:MAG: 2-amino-4-hydroxy-6-hydroxymethyldihydropteridine diphosphokinase [Gammaproteobacteria bacterium]
MARVYVSIGSNIEREQNIRNAVKALGEAFGELTLSTVYETEAVGFAADNFFNLVVGFDTEADVRGVAQQLREIEQWHGRQHTSPKLKSRTLDLDLLLYEGVVSHEREIDLPRKDIIDYAFVLRPLCEIAPDCVHPETGQRLAELWADYAGHRGGMWPTAFKP